MYTYIYVCMYVCMYVGMYVCTYVCMYLFVLVYEYICIIYIRMHVHMYVYICISIYIFVCACIHICMYGSNSSLFSFSSIYSKILNSLISYSIETTRTKVFHWTYCDKHQLLTGTNFVHRNSNKRTLITTDNAVSSAMSNFSSCPHIPCSTC